MNSLYGDLIWLELVQLEEEYNCPKINNPMFKVYTKPNWGIHLQAITESSLSVIRRKKRKKKPHL